MMYRFKLCCVFLLLAGTVSAQIKEESVQLFNKGQQLFMQGKTDASIALLSKAIQSDSSNVNAWVRRGFVKSTAGDFEGEMADYSWVIEHHPTHVWAYISRGAAYNRLEKYDLAIADLDKAIELDPSIAESFVNKGFSYKGKGDKETACSCWEKALKLGNDECKIILNNNHCK